MKRQNIISSTDNENLISKFDKQVDMFPHKIAIIDTEHKITFLELYNMSNAIANNLYDHISKNEKYIALLLNNDIYAIATIIGILRIGLAYIPLNKNWSLERIETIVKFTDIKTVIYQSNITDKINFIINKIHVDTLVNPKFSKQIRPSIHSNMPAYIIFTSGSTGNPKGIIHSHKTLLFDALRQKYDLEMEDNDIMGMISSISSSASGCAIFGGLLNGISVSCFQPEKRSLISILKWISKTKVTITDIPVSVLRVIASKYIEDSLVYNNQLRILAPIGETIYKKDINLCRLLFGNKIVIQNAYASTETRLNSQLLIGPNDDIDSIIVPVGQASTGKTIVLRDLNTNEVISSEGLGEIIVKSDFLAPYYLDMNKDKKLIKMSNIFYTGDIGARDSSGKITIYGRLNRNVILNGKHFSLDLLEGHFFNHYAVAEASIIGNNIDSIVCYLVLYKKYVNEYKVNFFRSYQSKVFPKLPKPKNIYIVKKLPKNDNGKIDKIRLAMRKRENNV